MVVDGRKMQINELVAATLHMHKVVGDEHVSPARPLKRAPQPSRSVQGEKERAGEWA